MDRAYPNRINWENRPSVATALGATNLNKIDYALEVIDKRVIEFDTTKFDATTALQLIKDITIDTKTGVIKATRQNGTVLEWDLNIEKIPAKLSLTEEGMLMMETDDGEHFEADLKKLIDTYVFDDTDTIDFEMTIPEGSTEKHVTAKLKDGSIHPEQLDPSYLAELRKAEADALAGAKTATDAADLATTAADNANTAADNADAATEAAGTATQNANDAADNANAKAAEAEKAAQNANTEAENAKQAAGQVDDAIAAAQEYVKDSEQVKNWMLQAESYAHGQTDARPGEETDNADYYRQLAENAAQKAKDEADRAGTYAKVNAPDFWLDPDDMTLYEKGGVGVDFEMDQDETVLYWKLLDDAAA